MTNIDVDVLLKNAEDWLEWIEGIK